MNIINFLSWDNTSKTPPCQVDMPETEEGEAMMSQAPQLLQEVQLIARALQSNLFSNPDFEK